MRIHLICDHKWRDLPNLAATKLWLQEFGHRVTIASTKETPALIGIFRPDCVVFNHFNGEAYRRLGQALREAGVAVVLLPTEGLPHPVALSLVCGEFTDYRLVDYYLAWNQVVADGIVATGAMRAEQIAVVGCGRTDFYTAGFRSMRMSRDAFARRLRLNPADPIVTWATQYNFADYDGLTGVALEKFLREAVDLGAKPCLDRFGLEYQAIPLDQRRARAAAVDAFRLLVRSMPDVQFVVKPHPAESVTFYRALAAGLESEGHKVRLCLGTYIWDVLNSSDVHLHYQCTTAVEAWLLGRPTVEMMMVSEPGYHWPEREQGSDIATTGEELRSIVSSRLAGEPVDSATTSLHQQYIRRWFHVVDGDRCHAVATALDGFLRGRRRRYQFMPSVGAADPGLFRKTAAAARFALLVPAAAPLSHLWTKGTPDTPDVPAAFDKLITRRDVRDYEMRLGPVLRPKISA